MTRLLIGFLLLLLTLPAAAQVSSENLVPQRIIIQINETASEKKQLEILAVYLHIDLIRHTRTTITTSQPEADVVLMLDSKAAGSLFELILTASAVTNTDQKITKAYTVDRLDIGENIEKLADFAKQINTMFPPLPPRIVEIVTERVVEEIETRTITRGTSLIIRGEPGTTIKPENRPAVLIPDSGELEYELAANTTFNYQASKTGFFPETRTIFIGSEPQIDLVLLLPLRRFELTNTYRYLSLVPAFGFNWFFKPGQHYIGASLEFSGMHLIRNLYTGLNYLDLQIQAGTRLGQATSRLRLGGAVGIAGRLDTGSGYLRLSDWAAFSALAAIDLQFRIHPRWAIFIAAPLRLHTVIAPYQNTNWFDDVDNEVIAQPFMHDMPLGIFIAEQWFLAAPEFLLGVRFDL